MGKKVICDIDGILCESRRVPYLLKKPNKRNIKIINLLFYAGYKIILFTSRKRQYRKYTLKWLNMHKVRYHKLIMGKPKGDYYCDDKSISLYSLKKNNLTEV